MYAKLIDDALVPAPHNATYEGVLYIPAPDEVIEALGYKVVVYEDAPECPEDYHAESGWLETETTITQIWTIVEDSPAVIVERLKAELSTYDYIGVKIAMGVAPREDYAEQIAYTETLRARIRELENSLSEAEE